MYNIKPLSAVKMVECFMLLKLLKMISYYRIYFLIPKRILEKLITTVKMI